MNHRHRKVLHTIFAHPVNNNIAMRDVEAVLGELGADVSESKTGKVHVELNGHSVNFHRPGHSLPKEEVIQVRKFMENCGVSLEEYPL